MLVKSFAVALAAAICSPVALGSATVIDYYTKAWGDPGGRVRNANSTAISEVSYTSPDNIQGYAFSDLNTGRLRASSRGGLDEYSPIEEQYTVSQAIMGDTFHLSSPGLATFNISLNGLIDVIGSPYVSIYFTFSILNPGGLYSCEFSRVIEFIPFGGCHSDPYSIAEFHYSVIGDQFGLVTEANLGGDPLYDFQLGSGHYLIDREFGISFLAPADFQWIASFVVTGSMAYPAAGYSYNGDFSHTTTLGYRGPDGTTTVSASGVFPGLQQTSVPEPTSVGLVLAALGAGIVVRRRRQEHHAASMLAVTA